MDSLTLAQEKTFKSAFGDVTVKVPSLMKRVEISKRMQMYAAGMNLDGMIWDTIESMATLDICATQMPEAFKKDEKTGGWDYEQIYDEASLVKLGKEVIAWLNSFRRALPGEQKEVGEN